MLFKLAASKTADERKTVDGRSRGVAPGLRVQMLGEITSSLALMWVPQVMCQQVAPLLSARALRLHERGV
jgi:hypothetical protein